MGVTKAEVYNTREWIAITPRLQHNHDSGGATGCRMPAALSPRRAGSRSGAFASGFDHIVRSDKLEQGFDHDRPQLGIGAGIGVVFRSAKERPFAERKATM
jgi:hypothetical protein